MRQQSVPEGQEEDREEEISGAQFLCETVIRSLALEEAPDHRPPRRAQHSPHKPQGEEPLNLYVSTARCVVMERLQYDELRLFYEFPVVSRGTSFCFERAFEAEKMETVQEGSEEICAVRLESSAPPLGRVTQGDEIRPGQRTLPGCYSTRI